MAGGERAPAGAGGDAASGCSGWSGDAPACSLRRRRMLLFGLLGTLVLLAVIGTIPLVELARLQRQVLTFAEDGHQASHLMGSVATQLARQRAHVALALRDASPRAHRFRARSLAHVDGVLDAALLRLPDLLSPTARAEWAALRAEIDRARRAHREAYDEARAGRAGNAARILATRATDAAMIQDRLDQLAQAHRHAMQAGLTGVHRRLAQVREVEILLAALVFAATIAIWLVVLRAMRSQEQRVDAEIARLAAANADLDAFAGRVAHDLKGALSPALLAPGLLRRIPDPPPPVEKVADMVERSCKKAISLVEGMLAFARAIAPTDEESSVPSVLGGVLEELAPEVERCHASVVVEVEDVRVRCGPGMLHVILANLVGNAVKFLEGQPERRVHVSAHAQAERCCIEVVDTGPGIPREAQAKIFEPFYRVPGTRAPGSGIGLATVQRVVRAHQGEIVIESSPGRGTRVCVLLPRAAEAAG